MLRSAMSAIAALFLLSCATPAFAWGNTGHRVTGAIAERYLTIRARSAIRRIIGVETLAQASTWPDFMRQSPEPFWRTAGAFHTVVVTTDGHYDPTAVPPGGDALTALRTFSKTVRDRNAPLAERQKALRFIVHIIGDLHNPLHACNGRDHCGGDVRVSFFDEGTNLHAVWDYELIDREQLAFTEWADWLSALLTNAQVSAWSETDPAIWIAESAALHNQAYPVDDAIGKEFAYTAKPIVEERLTKAGLRIAAYLNRLFE